MLSSKGRVVGGGGIHGERKLQFQNTYKVPGYLRVYFRLVGTLWVCPWTRYPLGMFSCFVHFNAKRYVMELQVVLLGFAA